MGKLTNCKAYGTDQRNFFGKHKIITGILILIVLIPIIFYLLFTIGMISTNSPKSIHSYWNKQYKTTVKTDFQYINDVNIYYQYGKINFDFTINPKMSLDQCKQVIKITKDFIENQNVEKQLLTEGHDDHSPIRIKFDSTKDVYLFESPYWIPTEDATDNPNTSIQNNCKIWYLKINDESQIKMVVD